MELAMKQEKIIPASRSEVWRRHGKSKTLNRAWEAAEQQDKKGMRLGCRGRAPDTVLASEVAT